MSESGVMRLADFRKGIEVVALTTDFLFVKRATFDLLVYTLWVIRDKRQEDLDRPIRLKLDWYQRSPYRVWKVTRGVADDMQSWSISDVGYNTDLPREAKLFHAPPTQQERRYSQSGLFITEESPPDGYQ